jgi:hypothetical protein
MLSVAVIISIIFLLENCGNKESENEIAKQKVNIYLIALEGSTQPGKLIGCNDILVSVERSVAPEKSALESALNELVEFKSTDELQNFVKGPGLILVQVTIARGMADVYFRGAFDISGACDIPRIKEQLYETAKQFTEYSKIEFHINEQTLENYLSVESKGF